MLKSLIGRWWGGKPAVQHSFLEMARKAASETDANEAARLYRIELEQRPGELAALIELAALCLASRQYDEASDLYGRAREIMPPTPALLSNLATSLKGSGRVTAALACLQDAVAAEPAFAEGWYNLGLCQFELGRLHEAEASYRRAIREKPDLGAAWSSLICMLNYLPQRDPATVLAECEAWARACCTANPLPAPARSRDADRPLRLGYVSADFRAHSVAYFVESLFEKHDRALYPVFLYHNSPATDRISERLHALAAAWRSVAHLDDDEFAGLIRRDEIDVLIDLSGHTFGHRLPAFSRRPAPVQLTYMGYLGTTGLPAMEYRITDSLLDPAGMTEALQSEKLIRMPACCICFRPYQPEIELSALPAAKSRALTFGSFNSYPKINDEVLDVWSRLLNDIPQSRLLMMVENGDSPEMRALIHQRYAARGVASERIEILGHRDIETFARLHHRVDIALDPFPYNGGTTTLHALWMGVPVITLEGRAPLSRCGTMMVKSAGLPQFVAASTEEYVQIGRYWAERIDELAALRSGLRDQFRRAPFHDAASIAHELEKCYRALWRTWCSTP